MAIPQIPVNGTETVTHRRRVAESINDLISFRADGLRSLTKAEQLAGVTPVNPYVPSHEVDGVVRLSRYVTNSIPGTTDLSPGMTAVNLVIASMDNQSAVVELPAGILYFSSGIEIAPTPYGQQIKLRGKGSGVTRVKYTGSGNAINFSTQTILQEVSGMTIDCTGASAGANGLHMDAWRSYVDDIYLLPPSGSTGKAFLIDNGSGTFDVKMSRFYISGWGIGIRCTGGNLTTSAVTNFAAWAGYVSQCGVNFKFSYALDVSIIGVQSESARTTLGTGNGIELDNVQRFTWFGGAIEGSDAAGISFGTGVTGVLVRAGMFNNISGDTSGSYSGDVNGSLSGGAIFVCGTTAGYGFLAGGVVNQVRSYNASPEGAVTGNKCDLVLDNSTVFPWSKAFGSATNTGWLQLGMRPIDVTAANLASAAHAINADGFKFAGKQAYDTTNHKLYIARGANATDVWDLCDGSASVTPV